MSSPLPRRPAPDLTVRTLGGGTWSLAEQQPEAFTLLVFYRGLHYPVCKAYLQTLHTLRGGYADLGVDAFAVSMDTEARARKTRQSWAIGDLPLGYGLSSHDWGLYLSEAVKDEEPDLFSEPGLFLVRPDGTLYLAAINSMPFGRPDLKGLVKRVRWILDNDYPARGEVEIAQTADAI